MRGGDTFVEGCGNVGCCFSCWEKAFELTSGCAPRSPSCRDMLLARLESFLHERVEQAAEDAALNACDKVVDGDVVLCYCYSQLVARSILEAKAQGKHFR